METVISSPTAAPVVGLYTLPQVARMLSVSKRTLERENARGRLVFSRVGRCVRVRAEDLAAYVAKIVPTAS